jgi:hypothetical protein
MQMVAEHSHVIILWGLPRPGGTPSAAADGGVNPRRSKIAQRGGARVLHFNDLRWQAECVADRHGLE